MKCWIQHRCGLYFAERDDKMLILLIMLTNGDELVSFAHRQQSTWQAGLIRQLCRDGKPGVMKRQRGRAYLQHEGVWWVHKDGGIVLGGGLQTKLSISGSRIIGEGDTGRQLSIIQQHLMMFCKQQVTLCLVLKSALDQSERERC